MFNSMCNPMIEMIVKSHQEQPKEEVEEYIPPEIKKIEDMLKVLFDNRV